MFKYTVVNITMCPKMIYYLQVEVIYQKVMPMWVSLIHDL